MPIRAISQAARNAICFTHGRIRFRQPSGSEILPRGLPTQGQAFSYFGRDVEVCAAAFEGRIVWLTIPRLRLVEAAS
jgi:hypothetical protein